LPETSRGASIFPLENNQWIVVLRGAHGDAPPRNIDGYSAFAKSLRTDSVYNAIKGAKRIGKIVRFNFPSSVRRRFERMGGCDGGTDRRFRRLLGGAKRIRTANLSLMHS